MADEAVVVRDPQLKWPGGYQRFWFRGNAFLTNSMNSLSTVIPVGERFFIESIRPYLAEIRDPVLRAQALAFVGQETAHGREHRRFNDLLAAEGHPVRRMAERVRAMLDQYRIRKQPRGMLAVTCALEHFTTILAAEFLRNPMCRESVSGDQARLWFWHSVEELEHKSVAFDVYASVGGTYGERVLRMIRCSLEFWSLWIGIALAYQSHERRLWSLREWWPALVWAFVRPGFMLRVLPRYLAYYRRDFHPSLHANADASLILDWRARLALVPEAADTRQ
jgi:uncharacterized protein